MQKVEAFIPNFQCNEPYKSIFSMARKNGEKKEEKILFIKLRSEKYSINKEKEQHFWAAHWTKDDKAVALHCTTTQWLVCIDLLVSFHSFPRGELLCLVEVHCNWRHQEPWVDGKTTLHLRDGPFHDIWRTQRGYFKYSFMFIYSTDVINVCSFWYFSSILNHFEKKTLYKTIYEN